MRSLKTRSLKTFAAASLLLLALSVPTLAGDMECGFNPPPPPLPITNQNSQTTASDADQNNIDGEDDGLIDSLFEWLQTLLP